MSKKSDYISYSSLESIELDLKNIFNEMDLNSIYSKILFNCNVNFHLIHFVFKKNNIKNNVWVQINKAYPYLILFKTDFLQDFFIKLEDKFESHINDYSNVFIDKLTSLISYYGLLKKIDKINKVKSYLKNDKNSLCFSEVLSLCRMNISPLLLNNEINCLEFIKFIEYNYNDGIKSSTCLKINYLDKYNDIHKTVVLNAKDKKNLDEFINEFKSILHSFIITRISNLFELKIEFIKQLNESELEKYIQILDMERL